MANKKLKIKLLPTGEIEMHTEGIKGKKCLDYIELMEVLADAKVVKQELTQEYYEEETETVSDGEKNSLYNRNL